MAIEIKMPELGDGIESGDVLEVLVKEGDVIEKEQGIIEVETDKATVEIPSTHAGKVSQIHVQEGDSVKIGAPIVSLDAQTSDSEGQKTGASPSPRDAATEDQAVEKQKDEAASGRSGERADNDQPGEPAVARSQEASPRERPQPADAEDGSSTAESPRRKSTPRSEGAPEETEPATASESSAGTGDTIPAGPAVRRFAREVGVDLRRVAGSGVGGRITREDVLGVVRQASRGASAAADKGPAQTDEWGAVRIEKLPKIRQTIARKMHESWVTAPRVTNFDDADVSELEHIRQASKADYSAKGIKLTSMPFIIKAVAMALRNHPLLNAAVDLENKQIIFKEYVNIGVAVDTDRGLIVPSLRDADKLAIPEIARRLAAMAENVREGSFRIEDLRGSTFTISNLGAIGGTYSTPIINVPEVAILLIGRTRKLPVVRDNDQIAVRLMMPLSLSYDHRLVDGAAAARFLNEVKSFLEAPSRLLLAP